tara:strand:- start:701 stop:1024 length:324 start_codon:yes stop_codon:yes gene_type:complete
MENFKNKQLTGNASRVEATLLAADELLLSELLDMGVTQDLTIRYFCALHKLLEENYKDVPAKYGDVCEQVKRVKGFIGSKRRSAAFKAIGKGWPPSHDRPSTEAINN